MPIYEYVCQACGSKKDVLQGLNDPPLTRCEECQQLAMVRLVSAAGFRLKGGGWYETDFKKESDKKKNLLSKEEPKAASNTNEKNATSSAPAASTQTTDSKT